MRCVSISDRAREDVLSPQPLRTVHADVIIRVAGEPTFYEGNLVWFTHKKFTNGEAVEAIVKFTEYSDINDEWYYTVAYCPHSADDYSLADDDGHVSRDVTEKFLKAREVPWTLFSDHCATV